MFLCTVIDPQTAKFVRRVFRKLCDAELFCDYCVNCRITIWELEMVDCELSEAFA